MGKRKTIDDDESDVSLPDNDESSADFESDVSDDDSLAGKKKKSKSPSKAKAKSPAKAKSTSNEKSTKSPTGKSKSKKARTNEDITIEPVNAKSSSSSNPSKSVGSSTTAIKSVSIADFSRGADITTENEARKVILNYFKQQNRPYSAIQVYDNLHHRAAKSVVEKALTNLCDGSNGLICKEYGKSKIYYVNQDILPKESDGDMDQIEEDIDTLQNSFNTAIEKEKSLKTQLSQLELEPVDSELDKVIEDVNGRLIAKRNRVQVIKTQNIDPNTMSELIKRYNTLRGLWKSRKEICMEVIEMITENANKKPKDFMTEIGVETDEDMGVKLPTILVEPTKRSK